MVFFICQHQLSARVDHASRGNRVWVVTTSPGASNTLHAMMRTPNTRSKAHWTLPFRSNTSAKIKAVAAAEAPIARILRSVPRTLR